LAIFAKLWHSLSSQRRLIDRMPTRNINLTHEQDEFVESIVRAGEYQNASEAIRDAVRALQQRRREDALKLERLRLRIEAGIDDLDRGDFVEVDDEDLEAFFDTLRKPEKNRSG
jgi:antitoxin ParD1/3/4